MAAHCTFGAHLVSFAFLTRVAKFVTAIALCNFSVPFKVYVSGGDDDASTPYPFGFKTFSFFRVGAFYFDHVKLSDFVHLYFTFVLLTYDLFQGVI